MKRNLMSAALFLLILLSFDLCFGVKDTIKVGEIGPADANSSVAVNLTIFNDEAVGGFTIPLSFYSEDNPDVVCDSIKWSSRFIPDSVYAYAGDGGSDFIDSTSKKLNIWAIWKDSLSAGDGIIATIYFTTGSGWNAAKAVPLDSTSYDVNLGIVLSSVDGYELDFDFQKPPTGIREIEEPGADRPDDFSLSQNYPNPFNPQTIIRFTLPSDARVKIEIFNILGQKVKNLLDQDLSAGIKEISWDGKDSQGNEVGSGIYFYRIKTREFSEVRRMVLLK